MATFISVAGNNIIMMCLHNPIEFQLFSFNQLMHFLLLLLWPTS